LNTSRSGETWVTCCPLPGGASRRLCRAKSGTPYGFFSLICLMVSFTFLICSLS
jgi:hypothetical protein